MKISVIIPVYNADQYLRQCIDSVLQQTLQDFELIIVDDGSTDTSGTILDEYQSAHANIIVIHKPNGGVSAARNDALAKATGDYVYIMDADDWLEPDALQTMLDIAEQTDADAVITDHVRFRDSGAQQTCHFFSRDFTTDDRETIQQLQRMVLHRGYSPYPTPEDRGIGLGAPWTKLLRRSLITAHNLTFDPTVRGVFDDGLFALSIFEYAAKVAYRRTITYHFRTLAFSLTHRYRPDQLDRYNIIYTQIQHFGTLHHKPASFTEAYYARVVLYFGTAFDTYFFTKDNHSPWFQNLREFLYTLKLPTYNNAIQNVNPSILGKREKRIVFFTKRHIPFFLWLLYRIKQ